MSPSSGNYKNNNELIISILAMLCVAPYVNAPFMLCVHVYIIWTLIREVDRNNNSGSHDPLVAVSPPTTIHRTLITDSAVYNLIHNNFSGTEK